MQKLTINLIDKIINTTDKKECFNNIKSLILIFKNLTAKEFEEIQKVIL